MTRKCSPADLDHAVELYVSGMSAENAARIVHTTEVTLKSALKARGLWRDRAAMQAIKSAKMSATAMAKSDLPIQEIAARYNAGESENELARAFGVSRSAIEARLLKAGVRRRDQAAANQLLAQRTPMSEHLRRIKIAQEASRGLHHSINHRSKIAQTRQARVTHSSPAERLLAMWLTNRGVATVAQQAIGPYNVDLGAYPVAVEIFGGTWHFTRDHAKRFRYLFDQGWHVIIVFVDGRRSILTEGAADYIVTFLKEATCNPTMPRQYRVIWGEGKLCASGSANGDELAAIVPRRGRHGRRPSH